MNFTAFELALKILSKIYPREIKCRVKFRSRYSFSYYLIRNSHIRTSTKICVYIYIYWLLLFYLILIASILLERRVI